LYEFAVSKLNFELLARKYFLHEGNAQLKEFKFEDCKYAPSCTFFKHFEEGKEQSGAGLWGEAVTQVTLRIVFYDSDIIVEAFN